ncbi:MAG: dTMP kinase [Spirochaetales bacterium]|nr:dTMP kinase [Spirochaetales bacterium]
MSNSRDVIRGFIVFEGIDGSGTTTQLERLVTRLDARGVPHSASCEPTDGPIGQLIRQALSGVFPASPQTVARLFAADRGEHLYSPGGLVEQATAGRLVVTDRYLFSSLAYQGLTCGPELPASLNAPFPLPEMVLYFHLPPATAARRMAERKSLDIYENTDFQERVATAYEAVMTSFEGSGSSIIRIDAAANALDVEKAVWAAVAPIVTRIAG